MSKNIIFYLRKHDSLSNLKWILKKNIIDKNVLNFNPSYIKFPKPDVLFLKNWIKTLIVMWFFSILKFLSECRYGDME